VRFTRCERRIALEDVADHLRVRKQSVACKFQTFDRMTPMNRGLSEPDRH
jgi:hypothetical protein